MRNFLIIGAGVLVSAVGLALISIRTWPILNAVETGRTPEYPDLVPRVYEEKASRVFDAALHAVNRLERWTLVEYHEELGEIRAEARTRVFRFVDDVLIRVLDRDDRTIVEVRSASRIGRADFGQNARNIRAFFQELDRQLQTEDHR